MTHFIGIGGIGMSALARILLDRGEKVSGSDQSTSPVVEELARQGAKIFIGHAPENLVHSKRVVYSTAVVQKNPEYEEAQKRNLPLLHRSDLLHELMQAQKPLLVAGTHGKTTTTSLLTHVLISAGYEPSFAIGGILASAQSNGRQGRGEYFVAEADESDGTFLKYRGHGAIITNIDNDHLDHWKNDANLDAGYKQFSKGAGKHLFWCIDDARLKALNISGTSYGFSPQADLKIDAWRQEGWKLFFSCTFRGKTYDEIQLPLIGKHNVLNAASVFGLLLDLGVSSEAIRAGFKTFSGVGRRAEKKGEYGSVEVYDDYGHHPTEIFTTLTALKKAAGTRRLVVAFQPHRFTRVRDCLDMFSSAFEAADLLIVTDIYSAGEKPIVGVTTETLLKKLPKAFYFARQNLTQELMHLLREGDLLVTLGAGDITKVGPEILCAQKSLSPKPSCGCC